MPHLKIECTNLRNELGQLLAVVWDDEKHFRSEDLAHAVATARGQVSGSSMVLDLGELPAGTYAVVVLHDENLNEKLDVSPMLGLPTEGIAFSNNPNMGLSGPRWEACSFAHEGEKTISIRLKYWL